MNGMHCSIHCGVHVPAAAPSTHHPTTPINKQTQHMGQHLTVCMQHSQGQHAWHKTGQLVHGGAVTIRFGAHDLQRKTCAHAMPCHATGNPPLQLGGDSS